jgi:hypothetical protein
MNLMKKVLGILLCFVIVFVAYDFVIIYKNVKKDNDIERNKCYEEYKASNCNKMTITDGPYLNDYCTEKLKCISAHTVYIHVVFIKYIRSFISNIVEGSNLILLSLMSITTITIIKILFL